MKILFWVTFILIVYTYIGYPVLVYILSQCYRKPLRGKYLYPTVSILVSAYNEEKNIEQKLRNLLKLEYPDERIEILVGSDGSTDRTDEIIKSVIALSPVLGGAPGNAEWGAISSSNSTILYHSAVGEVGANMDSPHKSIWFFRQEPRQGKPSMLNILAQQAKGDILVLTDARQRLDEKAILELVKYFDDQKVGAVSGELHYESEAGNKTAAGLGIYWKYEKFIRKSESRMGSMLGTTGALYAVRRDLYPQLPVDLILEEVYVPLKVIEKGFRAVFDKRAKVYDKVFSQPKEEFLRKCRTLAGNFQLFFYAREVFNPFRGKIAWQFFSHKFLRLMVPFLLVAMLVSNAVIVSKDCYAMLALTGNFYAVFFMLQIMFYIFAVLGGMIKSDRRYLNVPHMFCVMNAAAVVGLWQFLFKKQSSLWKKAG